MGARLYRREQGRRDQGRRAGRHRAALAVRTSGFAGRVARIEPESDRVNEERRIEIAFDQLPTNVNLGEQAEVYITTVQLPQALLVPEAAIVGLGKNGGTVWTVEDGRLQQHEVTLGHRLLDGRYEITGGVPDKAASGDRNCVSGLRVGRAAKIAGKSQAR